MKALLPASLLLLISQQVVAFEWRKFWPFASTSQPTSTAGLFKEIVCFGDSLSDDGHGSFALTNGTWPAKQYYQGRFSNGPTWVEHVAPNTPLRNYAVGGATSDNDLVEGRTGLNSSIISTAMVDQVNAYIASEVRTLAARVLHSNLVEASQRIYASYPLRHVRKVLFLISLKSNTVRLEATIFSSNETCTLLKQQKRFK